MNEDCTENGLLIGMWYPLSKYPEKGIRLTGNDVLEFARSGRKTSSFTVTATFSYFGSNNRPYMKSELSEPYEYFRVIDHRIPEAPEVQEKNAFHEDISLTMLPAVKDAIDELTKRVVLLECAMTLRSPRSAWKFADKKPSPGQNIKLEVAPNVFEPVQVSFPDGDKYFVFGSQVPRVFNPETLWAPLDI